MEEELIQKAPTGRGFVALAMEAVAFNKVIIVGLFLIAAGYVFGSVWIATHASLNGEAEKIVLAQADRIVQNVVVAVAAFLTGKAAGRNE